MNARQVLEQGVASGWLRPLDLHFALRMRRLAGTGEWPGLLLAAALVSQAVGRGDVCLDLGDAAGTLPWTSPAEEPGRTPPLAEWRGEILRAPVAGPPGAGLPLVLDQHDRLYLARYYHFEQSLAAALLARAGQWAIGVDHARLREGLCRLFPSTGAAAIDWQQIAAALAVLRPYCVISGGPGTGKTRTVTAILALLLEQTSAPLRMALAAPTGKAAARLAESMRLARAQLDITLEIAALLPDTASTLHRLLGFRSDRIEPRHDAANPLPLDLLVVDEASMVDLPLMSRLLAALRPDTRLILLGDRDQLASVEAGRVLGDICGPWPEVGYSEEQCRILAELTGANLVPAILPPLADHLTILRRSYRFSDDSGIGRLARAVNAGDGDGVLDVLRRSDRADLSLMPPDDDLLISLLYRWFIPRMRTCLGAGEPTSCLRALASFRILGAVHDGPFGVRRLNQLCEQALRQDGLLDPAAGAYYAGRPLLVTGNDYQLGLFNGDVGLIQPRVDGRLAAWFEGDSGPRPLEPARLPAHETVYAMTVHKSQGSEFDDLLLVLPEGGSPVVTRELLYTAVTRARRSLVIVARPEDLLRAVQSRTRRQSGLLDTLWGKREQ